MKFWWNAIIQPWANGLLKHRATKLLVLGCDSIVNVWVKEERSSMSLGELEDKFVISREEEITYLKFVAKIEQCKWDEMLKT
jgi:hypothetical protein